MTTKEGQLLAYLVDRADRTVTRDELLVHVWGQPRPLATRAVDNVVRRLRQKLGDHPRRPNILFTVYGEGYRIVVQPLPDPDDVQHVRGQTPTLRTPDHRFFGREEELQWLDDRCRPGIGIQVVGPGGVGKTRLVREFVQGRLGQQIVFCDLTHVSTARALRQVVSRCLGGWLDAERPEVHQRDLERATARLGPALIVLDNAEDALLPVAEVSRALLTASNVGLVVTTRRAIPGDHLRTLRLGPLSARPAAELFRDRARNLEEWNDDQVRRVVELLDGQPLALELAAARCSLLGPTELVERASVSLDVLARRTTPRASGRHRALDATIAECWRALPPAQKRALSELTCFVGGCTIASAERVLTTARGSTDLDTLDVLQSLVDASLLHRKPNGRLAMFHTVWLFARSHVPQPASLAARHGAHLAEVARESVIEIRSRRARWALERLDAERENLTKAAEQAPSAEHRTWVRLGLEAWLARRGATASRRAVLQAALDDLPEDLDLQARVYNAWGRLWSLQRDHERMEWAARQAELRARDPDVHAEALSCLALALDLQGRHEEANAHRSRARTLTVREGTIVDIELDAMVHDATEPAWRRLEKQVRGSQLPTAIIHFASIRSRELRHGGRTLEAERLLLEGLEQAQRLNWPIHCAGFHSMIGDLLVARGDRGRARHHLEQSVAIATPFGMTPILAPAHGTLGALALARDQSDQALVHLDLAVDLLAETTANPWAALVWLFRGVARALEGSRPDAESDLAEAQSTFDAVRSDAFDDQHRVCLELAQAIVATTTLADPSKGRRALQAWQARQTEPGFESNGDMVILGEVLSRLVGLPPRSPNQPPTSVA